MGFDSRNWFPILGPKMADEYDLRSIAPTVSDILGVPVPSGSESGPIGRVTSDLRGADRLALIVLDGLGSVVWEHAKAELPVLSTLAELHHMEIQSVLPSMTYICLSTMVTGVSPETHGIADLESMVAATQSSSLDTVFDSVRGTGQKTLLAVHERDVKGVPVARFADRVVLAKEPNDDEIYSQVPVEAERYRPSFLFVHLLDIDEAGHRYGPYSEKVKQSARVMNGRLGDLLLRLAGWGYAVILVADHGMHEAPEGEEGRGQKGIHDGSVEEDLAVPFIWATAAEVQRFLQA